MAMSMRRPCPVSTNTGAGRLFPARKLRDQFNGRLLRSGKADTDRRTLKQSLKPLERKREMRAALVVRYGMDLIHDDCLDRCRRIRHGSFPP